MYRINPWVEIFGSLYLDLKLQQPQGQCYLYSYQRVQYFQVSKTIVRTAASAWDFDRHVLAAVQC